MIEKLLNLFRRTPKARLIESFMFPTGNARINFLPNWQIVQYKKGESTFTFFNKKTDGVLYASELTNENPEYLYKPSKSWPKDHL